MAKISPSLEDYLETIMLIKERQGEIRLTEIAAKMNVAKSSVHTALKNLEEMKLLVHEKYGNVILLPEGEEMAKKIYARHKALTLFFEKIVGVSSETAQKDACAIEHIISPETMERIVMICEKDKDKD